MPRRPVQRPGERLRSALLDAYELEPHELVLLDSAAHTADLVADLQAAVDRQGVVNGERPNPLLTELRQQRLTLGRLLAGLRIPVEDKHLPHRGPRGFYGPRAVS